MILHDLFDASLALIGVLAEGQEASAEQCLLCLSSINRLLSQWELDGIDLEWSPQEMDALPEEAPLPNGSENAVIHFLGVMLAPYFRKTVTPEMIAVGQSFYDSLVRRAVIDQVVDVRVQRALGDGQRIITDITTL